ncbi:MAG: hypothetical protein B7Z81_01235 [Acidocella sp. 20-61-6]|nr:MAG: hypothetical protein B7Z81_01235 [Acidocella sp. 20-61-6]
MSDSPRILVVEQDVLVRHPLSEYLRECGYQVAEATSPAEAQALLGHDDVQIDIVLAEGEAGFELAGWVRAHHPEVEMLLAGTVQRATEKAGELCEAGPALATPYEHRLVLDRIRQMMAARRRKGSTT